MPKYFSSKAEQLLIEAQASYLLIKDRFDSAYQNSEFDKLDRLYKIYARAGARVYRRS
jgi:hypothetical protein